jgi:hypothetical protein
VIKTNLRLAGDWGQAAARGYKTQEETFDEAGYVHSPDDHDGFMNVGGVKSYQTVYAIMYRLFCVNFTSEKIRPLF